VSSRRLVGELFLRLLGFLVGSEESGDGRHTREETGQAAFCVSRFVCPKIPGRKKASPENTTEAVSSGSF